MSTIESVSHETRVFEPPARIRQRRPTYPAWTLRRAVRRSRSATSRASGRAWRARRCCGQAVHQGAGRVEGAVLQVVRRRRAERLVQLPRPAPRERSADKVAIIFEADDGAVTKSPIASCIAACAASPTALKRWASSRATASLIYMPMSIEAVVAMQACARIGATHSVVFGGFSAKSAAGAHHRRRRGRGDHRRRAAARRQGHLPLKAVVDEALAHGRLRGDRATSIVYKRTGSNDRMITAPRDLWCTSWSRRQADTCEPEWVERRASAVHPVHLGLDRQAEGHPALHRRLSAVGDADDASGCSTSSRRDVFWCTADIGWVTGHTYIAYGPLAVGAHRGRLRRRADVSGRRPLLEDRSRSTR